MIKRTIAILMLASCASPPEETARPYHLAEVARYGWASVEEADRILTAQEERHGAGILADVLGVTEDENGNVYAVDAGYFKVVRFRRDGTFDRIVVAGAGRGPGEFTRPRSISLGDSSSLWIFDQGSNQVVHVDSSGKELRRFTVPMSGLLDVKWHDGKLYGVRSARAGEPQGVILDPEGAVISQLPPPTTSDEEMRGERVPAALGFGRDEIIVAHATIGEWTRVRGEEVMPRNGSNAYPSLAALQNEAGERIPQTFIWGVAVLEAGEVAIYHAFSGTAPDTIRGRFALAIHDEAGTMIGNAWVPTTRGTFHSSVRSGEVLVVQSEPYPQIVRYRVTADEER